MWRRRRDRAPTNNSQTPSIPPERPRAGLPPNTPGVQIFGENYSGPRVLQDTDHQKTMERNSKINSIIRSVKVEKIKDPVEKLKLQLKELDRALEEAVLDEFEYEEARRSVLEKAKKAIANKKKRESVKDVNPATFEREATEELENDDEVQTLLVNNTVVSAVPLNTKSSINQANEVIIHIEDEAEALLRELQETPDVQVETTQPVQAEAEPRVVSAFVIEDLDTSNIVLGDGDFVIESQPQVEVEVSEPAVAVEPAPTTSAVPVETEPTPTALQSPAVEVTMPDEVEEERPQKSSVIFGGGMMFTVDDTEDTPAKQADEDAELEMLMLGMPSEPKKVEIPKKKKSLPKVVEIETVEEVPKKKKSVVTDVDIPIEEPLAELEAPKPTQEDIEKQQAIEFGFKEENPPNLAQEAAVEEEEEEEEEEPAVVPMKPSYAGGMFLGFSAEEETKEKKGVSEEDELALLMMETPVEKPKPELKPVPEKPKPVLDLKPQKKKSVKKKKPPPKLSYKPSKQAVLTKDDEEAMAMLLSGNNPTTVKKPSRTIVNNALQLVDLDESDSDSDEELRYAGKAKPLFITTADQQPLMTKKVKKKKKKIENLYPTERLQTQGPMTVEDVQPEVMVRAKVVHGLIKGMEDEGKTPAQCWTSLQDLKRWNTITEDELELAKEILVKTKGLVL